MYKNKKAIVTLTIGDKYVTQFNQLCRANWEQYCLKHGFDLIVYDKHLDNSARSLSRSPAWQKLLILSQEETKHYDQVVWVDSDVVFNVESPDITLNIEPEFVGAVIGYSLVSKDLYSTMLERLYQDWRARNIPFVDNSTPESYHKVWGFTDDILKVVQTGVMVLSSKHHRETFEFVYSHYDDRGDSSWNYEMRPLSYELQKRNKIYWLDSRFNMIWPDYKAMFYAFLFNKTIYEKIINKSIISKPSQRQKQCVQQALANNYFLHFAGTQNEMNWLE